MNMIILLTDKMILGRAYKSNFEKGDMIWGEDSDPQELKRWSTDNKEEAKKQEEEAWEELAKYKCRYENHFDDFYIEEYALAFCTLDADGNLIDGPDYDLAEDERVARAREIVELLRDSDKQNPQLLEEFCSLAEMEDDWEEACLLEEEIAEESANEYDGESCEDVIWRAEKKLGVWL